MICDIANAYPSNGACVNADRSIDMGFDFYGDYCYGVDIDFYYADTGKKHGISFSDRGYYTGGYYNGERISISGLPNLVQNTKYYWQARLYSKKINISSGEYPDILVTKGKILKNPIIKTAVTEFSEQVKNASEKAIAIDKGLDIEIPSYVFIGEESRKIVSYDDIMGIIGVDKQFTTYPEVDTEVVINNKANEKLDIESTSNIVFIEPNNTIITRSTYSVSNDGDDSDSGIQFGTYIKINDEYRAITGHDTITGVVTFENPFSFIPTEGDIYEVYCNYIDSPFYNFVTKSIPTVTASAELWTKWNTVCLKCTAVFNANNSNNTIKSYHWEIYKSVDGANYTLSEKSEEIYSGRLEYFARIVNPIYDYKVKVVILTNDNIQIEDETVIGWGSSFDGITNLNSYFDKKYNRCILMWDNIADNSSYIVLRTDSSGKEEYLETIIGSTDIYYDYKVSNREKYVYSVIPKTNDNIGDALTTEVSTNFNYMSIYFLSEVGYEVPPEYISATRVDVNTMYGDAQYKIEKMYSVELNFNDVEITHNIKRDIQIGHTGLPIVTVGADSYDSFSLEFTFGQIKCINGNEKIDVLTQKDYLEWRNYIASGLPVIIKDIIGNIWFGTITEHNPKPDTTSNLYMYNISINFTQTRDMDKTRILTN